METKLCIDLLEGERWWGGRVSDGIAMPFGTEEWLVDLSSDLDGNQGCPLLISNKGRFVWSERAFAFAFRNGNLSVSGETEIEFGDGYHDLRSVYQHVSRTYFAASGTYPDELLFTVSQYNLLRAVDWNASDELF